MGSQRAGDAGQHTGEHQCGYLPGQNVDAGVTSALAVAADRPPHRSGSPAQQKGRGGGSDAGHGEQDVEVAGRGEQRRLGAAQRHRYRRQRPEAGLCADQLGQGLDGGARRDRQDQRQHQKGDRVEPPPEQAADRARGSPRRGPGEDGDGHGEAVDPQVTADVRAHSTHGGGGQQGTARRGGHGGSRGRPGKGQRQRDPVEVAVHAGARRDRRIDEGGGDSDRGQPQQTPDVAGDRRQRPGPHQRAHRLRPRRQPTAINPTAAASLRNSPPLPSQYPPTTSAAAMTIAAPTTRIGERMPPPTAAAIPRRASTTVTPPAPAKPAPGPSGKRLTPRSSAAVARAPPAAKARVRTSAVSTPIRSAAAGAPAVTRSAAPTRVRRSSQAVAAPTAATTAMVTTSATWISPPPMRTAAPADGNGYAGCGKSPRTTSLKTTAAATSRTAPSSGRPSDGATSPRSAIALSSPPAARPAGTATHSGVPRPKRTAATSAPVRAI